jgi:ribosomal protein S1
MNDEKPTNDAPPSDPPRRSLREAAKGGGPPRGGPVRGDKVPAIEPNDFGFGGRISKYDKDLDRGVDRDLAEAMGDLMEGDLARAFGTGSGKHVKVALQPKGPRIGKVMSVRGKDVFVDVGGRLQGVMNIQMFEDGPPAVGTEVEVHIEGYDPDGLLVLTRQGAAVAADWSIVAVGMLVEGRVTGTNKGGLEVEVNGIRAFMPISQIELFRVEDLNVYLNTKFRCLVTEVDREDKNLLVSRRALLEQEREAGREKLWETLAEGQVHEGTVRTIKPFGAFVDIGGADGLLPVGEMSWSRVNDPSEVVQSGQKVRVVVLRLDREARKITLGLRQLMTSPWDQAALTYPPGAVVKGKVTRTTDFGAFVELEPGVEGLVHISELSPARVRRVDDVAKVDQEVVVKVLTIDVPGRRLGLSIKAALKAPEPVAAEPEEEEEAPKPLPKRTISLRGGVGQKIQIELPKPPETPAS